MFNSDKYHPHPTSTSSCKTPVLNMQKKYKTLKKEPPNGFTSVQQNGNTALPVSYWGKFKIVNLFLEIYIFIN
ncbi:hypothetical protein DFA_12181 [Cavenderia fasciculata]|uniref:Uncharacterized protein n=1 Tax=Cavenderia fasciculata TaxID=261658 RepID=F4QCI1_CACFS|nr:uncharacterized protein DFA_12181 [Cavenderia fasciculata]EGG14409.1 hypothetical protein DFA_12181 [Cavenderia fasciculata]|eukprot:XP_004353818.1 hypothetical protein DFA_12181 [Cavenderia fasciculata]